MEAKMTPFLFEGEALVRVLDREGDPWFVGVDICRVLGLKDHKQALDRLDEDERGRYGIPTPGGVQDCIIVSEPGLYRMTFRSTKPVAERLKRWLAHEVLPAVRRTGSYQNPAVERIVPQDAVIRPKPFEEWTLEEIRTHLSVANGYRHTLNNASAAWYLMREGFPRPPERLMPAWWQGDLDIGRRREGAVVVVVPNGGSH